jgi:hypothetical protein
MKNLFATTMTALLLGALMVPASTVAGAGGGAARADDDDGELTVRDTERVQRSLSFTGTGPYRLEIDNVFGSIQVAAYDGNAVELTVTKTFAARTADRLEAARKEVTLDVKEEPGLISLFVDGPFRDCWKERRERLRWTDSGYRVRHDFVLRVPRQIALFLRTVNQGEIKIEGTTGQFDVSNVNGGIEMLDIAGTGKVHTVNRDLRVVFRENPAAASSFGSVNGDLVVCFQPALAADLRLKTFNGGLYSDFETTGLPSLMPVSERRNGKFVYKTDKSVGVRVGSGGPELRFETLNGDIRILQRRK